MNFVQTDSRKFTACGRSACAVLFLLVLAPVCAWLTWHAGFSRKADYPGSFPFKRQFVELNGGFCRCEGRRMCNGVVRTGQERRFLTMACETGPVEGAVASVKSLNAWLKCRHVDYLYVQTPRGMDLKCAMLPPTVAFTAYSAVDRFLAGIVAGGVKALDLRARFAATPQLVERYFYRTDHHWNNDAAFEAFQLVSERLGAPVDASKWKRSVIPGSFLGSFGRRTGRTFSGLDDMVLYRPLFRTHMLLELPYEGVSVRGTFGQTVMRNSGRIAPGGKSPKLLERAYTLAYVGAVSGLTRHRNPQAPLKKRILMVGDSYMRPFEAFLSTSVSELDVIDLRRYAGGSFADHVCKWNPDLVIQLHNPGCFGGQDEAGGNSAFFRFGLPADGVSDAGRAKRRQ